MFNPILDNYPNEYEGYLIRTSFRVGYSIMECMESEEYNEYEKINHAVDLLFGEGKPDQETALRGIIWYLSGGLITNEKDIETEEENEEKEQTLSFAKDARRINTAFKRVFNTDLSTANMHWFEFLDMLGDLSLEECAHLQTMGFRSVKINSKMPKEQRKFYEKMKRKYALTKGFKEQYTVEEQAKIDAFDEFLKGK